MKVYRNLLSCSIRQTAFPIGGIIRRLVTGNNPFSRTIAQGNTSIKRILRYITNSHSISAEAGNRFSRATSDTGHGRHPPSCLVAAAEASGLFPEALVVRDRESELDVVLSTNNRFQLPRHYGACRPSPAPSSSRAGRANCGRWARTTGDTSRRAGCRLCRAAGRRRINSRATPGAPPTAALRRGRLGFAALAPRNQRTVGKIYLSRYSASITCSRHKEYELFADK